LLGRSSVDVLIVVCDDIVFEAVLARQGVTRLANRDAVGSNEPRNAKIKHRVVVGTKHEHVRVRVEATVVTS
jgi:hypothetical protein